MRRPVLIALLALLALAGPACALDALQSTSVSGRVPPLCSTTPGGLALNRADRTLTLCDPTGSPSVTTLLNAVAAGRKAVEQGNASDLCAVAPWASRCRTAAARLFDTINVLDGQDPADAGVRDDIAIQAALNAAGTRQGASVYLPPRPVCYTLSAPITLTQSGADYLPTLLHGGGAGTCLRAGVAMESMVTANGRFARIEGINFSNQGAYATNAVTLTCATGKGNTNNFSIIEKNYVTGFVNGVKNANCDGWRVAMNWFQNQTGWDVWSADNGTNSRVERNYSLGSAGNVLMDSANYKAEGYYIDANHFLPTAGRSLVLRACLSCFVRGNQLDQTNDTVITLDGTKWPIADYGISDNWLGTKVSHTAGAIGLDVVGNVVEGRITGNTVNGFTQCGLRLRGTAEGSVQDTLIAGLRARGNGTGAGSGDVCIDTAAGGVGAYTVRDSWLLSTGGSVRSAIEGAGAIGLWTGNRFSAAVTKSAGSVWRDNLGDDRDIATGAYVGWNTFTFTPTCLTGTIGPGATGKMRYERQRNTVNFAADIAIPNVGSCSGSLVVKFPFAIAAPAFTFFGRNSTYGVQLYGYGTVNRTDAQVWNHNEGFPAGDGHTLTINGTYEAVP